MPATQFACPDCTVVPITSCLNACKNKERCMFKPTLVSIAKQLERKTDLPTVTELLNGTRESYLKRTTEYAVSPHEQIFALLGSGVHQIHVSAENDSLCETRIFDEELGISGQPDVFGDIMYDGSSLGDYKVVGSYAMSRALGYWREEIATGEYFKSGLRKGMPKMKKVWRDDGVKFIMPYALQLNIYRLLLERKGYKVDSMYIEFICRDHGLQIARERNIDTPVKVVKINKISDWWLERYIKVKVKRLNEALENNTIPPVCSTRERWGDRKCLRYCAVADQCQHALALKQNNEADKAA